MSLDVNKVKEAIVAGKTALGIELGSTRIKAVLINEENLPIASGSHDWENQLVDGILEPTAWRIFGRACSTAIRSWQTM